MILRSRGRARRGSALILVLLMTLAVAALAIAAIFMSSSAGLLSRFYDRERDFRLAAEAALAITRSRLEHDLSLAVPDTGMVVLASGFKVPTATGGVDSRVSVNVYAAATGDTTGAWLPHVTLLAAAYDVGGTRHVRRLDLRRESFARYQLLVDSFPTTVSFGPGTTAGRVHSNTTWRSGGSAATAGQYLDSISAVGGFTGTATYSGDTVSGVPPISYPRDSTFAQLTTLATGANLSFAPVSGTGLGWTRGSRLEFVAFDADGDTDIEIGEGYARIFDLEAGMDTSRLRVSIDASSNYILFQAKPWNDPVVQNQCGAMYWRDSKWQFFPVSTHRADWADDIIQRTGAANFPAINNPTMDAMDDYDANAVLLILSQTTARCFPAGSPYLMTAERMTDGSGVITGTAADIEPWGEEGSTGGYGGQDTTFTPRSRTCTVEEGGGCVAGTIATLGSWRAFGGTAVSGIASTVRQANELPYLWPLGGASNPASRGVMRATGGPLFVSGLHRGQLTLVVDGAVIIIDQLEQVRDPADPDTEPCEDQLGIVATQDILVADNALTRARRIGFSIISSLTKHFGSTREVAIHAQLMSLTGTVGTENPSTPEVANVLLSCPADAGGNTAGGCFRLVGGAAMRTYTPLYNGSNTGMRWAGVPDRCQNTTRRPPFFPLTNRYTAIRTLEIQPSLANSPAKVRAILQRLKGKSL